MKKEFKIILEKEDSEDLLLPYLQAENRENFLWELFNNFHRKWKHTDKNPDYEEIREALHELKQEYKILLKNDN